MAINHDKNKTIKKLTLIDIFDEVDEFGLLNVQAKSSPQSSRLEITHFEKINTFIDHNGRNPNLDNSLEEKMLIRSLEALQSNKELHHILKPYDRHNLLSIKAENVTSLDDIFASDEFNDLDLGDSSIFDLQYVPDITKDREQPDEVAQRKVCLDFDKFEHIFLNVHRGLKSGEYSTARFQYISRIEKGDLFISEGVLCYIDEIGEYQEDNQGRYDPRLRVIFENGTEINLLLYSLVKRLYTDKTGRTVVLGAESIEDAFNNITAKDKRTGQIYIVQSLSNNSTLRTIPNLYKIGFTTSTVEERTKSAMSDVAFLEAPIKIKATFDCFNLSPSKFESLIHGFLYAQRLKITLIGKNGNAYNPKEWFTLPLDTAIEVIERIIDGSIVNYRMDNTTNRIVKKS